MPVPSVNADLYNSFPPGMIDDGPQSSEDGSGLHSPVFGGHYPTHGDSYPLDVQHSASIMAPTYDYGHSHALSQQPPILDSALELPSTSARHSTFSHQYSVHPARNHLLDFPVQSPMSSRMPSGVHSQQSMYTSRYDPTSERRLPGGPSHDHSPYARPPGPSAMLPMDAGDHRTAVVSATRAESLQSAPQSSSPGTQSRKETSGVVIACRQCRARKIRCDSTRPVCNNCSRRSNPCEYDLVPKRRGPDKRPGTRQRSCKKRPADGSAPPPPKRKRTTTDRGSESQRDHTPVKPKLETVDTQRTPPLQQHRTDSSYPLHPHSASSTSPDLRLGPDPSMYKQQQQQQQSMYRRGPQSVYDQGLYTKSSYPRQLDINTLHFPDPYQRKYPAPTSPTGEHEQRDWWGSILRSYTLPQIRDEIVFLTQNTPPNLLSFINVDFLQKRLLNESDRIRIQPAFIFACLAMAKLMRSSTMDEGRQGQQHASSLATEAHDALRDSMHRQWFDVTLAEAAVILALFESSAHPQHTPSRALDALITMDDIIRTARLSAIDENDRDAPRFSRDNVPTVSFECVDDPMRSRRCNCIPSSPIDQNSFYNGRSYHVPWGRHWSPDEIRDEETRRVVWTGLSMVSDYVAQVEALNPEENIPRFHLSEPENICLLFPAEVLERAAIHSRSSEGLSPKESIWALYCRLLLLWNFANRFRQPMDSEDRAEQASGVFSEVELIEESLHMHHCNLDSLLIYTCREYIHNIRVLVTQVFRTFHGLDQRRSPNFERKQARNWLYYQDQVIRKVNAVTGNLNSPEGIQFRKRPYQISWFINQLAICLELWRIDPGLTDALNLARTIFMPIDIMNVLWPCPTMQKRCDGLRQQLIEACSSAQIDPPLSMNYSVPHYLQSATGH